MRRVRASIKVGRRGKRNKETKGIQGGGAPRGAGLRPGRVSPGQESPVPEKQELHQSSRAERRSQGVRAGPQEGGDALGLPGTLTDTCAPGECAELPKGCSAHGMDPGAARRGSGGGSARRGLHGPGSSSAAALRQRKRLRAEGAARLREQLGGARAAAPQEGAARPGARIQQRRPRSTGRRDTAQDPASPGTGRGREGPGQQGRSCPELSRSAAPPQSLQALQMECSGVTAGAESRSPELAAATGVVPPGASRGKQPPLSPAPGRGQSSSPKC